MADVAAVTVCSSVNHYTCHCDGRIPVGLFANRTESSGIVCSGLWCDATEYVVIGWNLTCLSVRLTSYLTMRLILRRGISMTRPHSAISRCCCAGRFVHLSICLSVHMSILFPPFPSLMSLGTNECTNQHALLSHSSSSPPSLSVCPSLPVCSRQSLPWARLWDVSLARSCASPSPCKALSRAGTL